MYLVSFQDCSYYSLEDVKKKFSPSAKLSISSDPTKFKDHNNTISVTAHGIQQGYKISSHTNTNHTLARVDRSITRPYLQCRSYYYHYSIQHMCVMKIHCRLHACQKVKVCLVELSCLQKSKTPCLFVLVIISYCRICSVGY